MLQKSVWILLASLLLCSTVAMADGPTGELGSGGGTVRIRVRTVKATLRLPDQELPDPTSSQGAPIDRIVDDSLFDLAPKLEKLHFKKFHLVSSQDEVVPMMKKATMYLQDGNTLSVRPLYLDGPKIGMWLRWQSATGVKILDTRMHFHCGESMLTGTDGDGDSGMVLAIDVARVKD